MDQFEGVVGPAEVDHLAAHAGQDVRAERLVTGFLGGVQGEDEVLLGGGLEAHVVAHPARELGQFGSAAEQPLRGGGGLRLLEQVGDLVELTDHGLAAQSAAALRVPLAEHRGGGLQQVELRAGEPGGAAGGGRVRLSGGGGHDGHQPALHGFDEGGAGGEGEGAAEESAAGEHQVAAGELAEQGDGLRSGPGQIDAGHRRGLVRGA